MVGFSRETSWLLGYHHRKYPFHRVLGGPDGPANWHGSPTFLPQHPSSTGHSSTVLQVTLGHSCGLLRGVFSMPSSYESGLKPCTPIEHEMVYVWYIPLVYGIMLILYQDWDHGIYMVYPNKRNSLYWDVHLPYIPWKYVHHNVLL